MLSLNFKKSGTGPPLIILHGLFGMLDNWQSIANKLEAHYTVYLVDQRNHGRSPHHPSHTYPDLAEDIVHMMNHELLKEAFFIGHSMGGKTVMQLALEFPERVQKAIVVDIGPQGYPSGHDDIFEALFSIYLDQVHYRSDAEKVLLDKIQDFGVRQFLLKNMYRNTDGTYAWRMNLQALYDQYAHIRGPVEGLRSDCPMLFVRGGNSNYISDSDWLSMQSMFPNAKLATIEGAGHWVHADHPDALYEVMHNYLQDA